MKKSYVLALLVMILLLASATRFDAIDERSLWEDEGWTLLLSDGDSLSDVVQTMAYDQHPPLYFVFIKYWRDLTGDSELALRTLSVLMSILGVAGIYQCRTIFNCTPACPRDIEVTRAIGEVKLAIQRGHR